MSKVYILYKEDIFSNERDVAVVAVFSSYASVVTWLKSKFKFRINCITEVADTKWFIVYEDTRQTVYCEVHDLIGETSHKTGKLVLSGR